MASIPRTSDDRLWALAEWSMQAAAELDPRRLIERFGDAARRIVGARYGMAGILDAGGASFQLLVTSGPDGVLVTSGSDSEAAADAGVPDPNAGPLGAILRGGRSVRLRNPSGDAEALGFSRTHPPVHAWLGAPIASATRVYGFLGLIDKLGADEFGEEDERLAGLLAAQVGRMYQMCSLYAEAIRRAAGLETEKIESIARLAGGVAHVFNNLLTIINGYGELLARNLPAESDQRHMAGEIALAGRRGAEFTQRLQLLSQGRAMPVVEWTQILAEVEMIDAEPESGKADAAAAAHPAEARPPVEPV